MTPRLSQRIALLTAHTAPLDAALRRALDQLLAEELDDMARPMAELGMTLEAVPWVTAEAWGATEWSRYAAVLVKSAWDYQDKADRFLTLLERAAEATPVFNDPALVRWNIRKTYLDDFAA
jgi:hypothetical protein